MLTLALLIRSIVSAMCEMQLKYRKRFKHLMLGLNEAMKHIEKAVRQCYFVRVLDKPFFTEIRKMV